jgi:GDP-L-fucose synthase
MPDVILVTGGHGLVGKAIQHVLATEAPNSRYGRRDGETWIFARSGDGDLRYEFPSPLPRFFPATHPINLQIAIFSDAEATRALLKNTNLPTSFTWLLSVRYWSYMPKIERTDSWFRCPLVGGLFMHLKYKVSMLRDNILINDNVLHTSYLDGRAEGHLVPLDVCVPDGITAATARGQDPPWPPHHSNFGYAHAKRLVDVANRAYKEQYGLNYTAAIPTNIYGPNDN